MMSNYSPEELASFRTVFEDAIASFSPMMLTTSNRLQVAQNILACAATGERDQSELRLTALANVKASQT
ncbi:hypothetical protein [Bradyrhizobium liaoningense]|uniref:hypothetical protein n=1 Tax=Bradyrhizobium liaoningense TaxID=43992 RepID=UPI001BA47E05|nr:hypothetical protein [Bradyrhizobium liaoningense]MBR0719681.1 hypothetical protein [Bradyrhizobium liaoningense]